MAVFGDGGDLVVDWESEYAGAEDVVVGLEVGAGEAPFDGGFAVFVDEGVDTPAGDAAAEIDPFVDPSGDGG